MLANFYFLSVFKVNPCIVCDVASVYCFNIAKFHTTDIDVLHLVIIWNYRIELWGCRKPSNTKILQTLQSKMLRMISSAPWYVSNQTLHSDFETHYVTEVVRSNANKYKNRSTKRSNQLIRALFNPLADRRLKRLWPEDLAQ